MFLTKTDWNLIVKDTNNVHVSRAPTTATAHESSDRICKSRYFESYIQNLKTFSATELWCRFYNDLMRSLISLLLEHNVRSILTISRASL